jgi:outer membrane translocation and assembly module TamA
LDIAASYKAPSFVVNFYGFGNDSKLQSNNKSFYRVRAKAVHLNPGLSRSWNSNLLRAGLLFNSVKVEKAESKFIGQIIPSIDSSVFSNKYFAGANFSYTLNTSDNYKNPSKGINYTLETSYQLNLKKSKRDFLNLESACTFYYSPFKNFTIAHRTGAGVNFGNYEFYQANTIGGNENLRGYWRTRFTGQTSFYQNTDIRLKLADVKGYVFRGALGVYGFFDDGRVWIKNEKSTLLHTGYGGGIYYIPYSTLAINLSYAISKEVNVFTFRTGFLF